MDLNQYLRVLWRFRIIVAAGLVLAILLAVLSVAKVDLGNGRPSLSYRGSERWASGSSVFVTQKGFPLGRSIYDQVVPTGDNGYVPRFNDPSRFASYAQLYAELVSSDLLRTQVRRGAPPPGSVSATAASDPRNPGIVLPLVQIQGTGATPQAADHATTWATNALISYVQHQQVTNKIAPSKRVLLHVLDNPSTPTLIAGRSKTRPAFIFFAILTACAALVFTLDNLKPQKQPKTATQPLTTEPQQPPQPVRAASRWPRSGG